MARMNTSHSVVPVEEQLPVGHKTPFVGVVLGLAIATTAAAPQPIKLDPAFGGAVCEGIGAVIWSFAWWAMKSRCFVTAGTLGRFATRSMHRARWDWAATAPAENSQAFLFNLDNNPCFLMP